MNKSFFFVGIIILQLCSSLVFAGGPLVIEGPDGNTAVTYQNPNITLHVESGDLGTLSNLDADAILKEAFDLWNTVNTSTVNLIFDEDALINVDIDISNFDQYIPSIDGTIFNGDDGLNPIVYDSDGAIIDAFFGENASDDIAGFAASIFNLNGSYFNEGYAVISGKQLDPATTEFKLLIAHEIGHFFGLDHTQANISNQETDLGFPLACSTSARENYPLMYPFICRDVETLHLDDISALSALYPTDSTDPATYINNNFGIIEGRFVDESGNAILGANIWAENITTGETISIVSDYLKQCNGYYKLVLPPGDYTLHANSINELFNGGSSVGPYAFDLSDKSFVDPHPIAEVTYQGVDDSADEIITVSTGQTTTINFSITGSDPVIINDSSDLCSAIVISDSSSGSSGTSYITLLLLLSFLLLARYLDTFFVMTVGWARFFAHAERPANTWAKKPAHPTKT